MQFAFLVSFTYKKFQLPNAPIYNWYKLPLSSRTIWADAFKSVINISKESLNQTLITNRVADKLITFDLRSQIDDFLKDFNSTSSNSDTSSALHLNSKLLSDESQPFEKPELIAIDFPEYGFSYEEGYDQLHRLYNYSFVIFPLTIAAIINILFFIFYCFFCCCPCCRKVRSDWPNICSIIAFSIGAILILLGYIFDMFSITSLTSAKNNICAIPSELNNSIDNLSSSAINIFNAFKNVTEDDFDLFISSITSISDFATDYLAKINTDFEDMKNKFSNESTDPEQKGYVATLRDDIRDNANENQESYNNYINGYTPAFKQFCDDNNIDLEGIFDISANVSNELLDKLEQLRQSIDAASELKQYLDDKLDFFDYINEHISSLTETLHDISNIESSLLIEEKTIPEYLTDLKDSDSISEGINSISSISEDIINKNWIYVILCYAILLTINLIYIFAATLGFFSHNCCCSCCCGACANIYPLFCTVILFIVGLATTIASTFIIIIGQKFPSYADDLISASINKSFQGPVYQFPALNLSDTIHNIISDPILQLPDFDLSNLTFFKTFLESEPEDNITQLFSLDKIIDVDGIKEAIISFLQSVLAQLKVEFSKVTDPLIDSVVKDFDKISIVPDNYSDFQEQLFNISQTGDSPKNFSELYDSFKSICYALSSGLKEIEDNYQTQTSLPSRTDGKTPETFETLCNGSWDSTTLEEKLETKYNSMVDAKQKMVDDVKKVPQEAMGSFDNVSDAAIKTIVDLFTVVPETINEIKAGPIISAIATFSNIIFHDMSLSMACLSMGSTLIVFGFPLVVLLLCIRRRGMMKLSENEPSSYTSYSASRSSSGSSSLSDQNSEKNIQKVEISFKGGNNKSDSGSSYKSNSDSLGAHDSRYQI